MMKIIKAHNILKGFFGICLCWYLILKNWVSKSLKFGLKWQFLYFKPILLAILVTIATGKSKTNAKILHLGYSSNKTNKMKLVKSNFSVFGSRGGQNSPLMHIPL